jgi:hypothetical protein
MAREVEGPTAPLLPEEELLDAPEGVNDSSKDPLVDVVASMAAEGRGSVSRRGVIDSQTTAGLHFTRIGWRPAE